MPLPPLDAAPAPTPCPPPPAFAPKDGCVTESIRVRHIGNGVISVYVSGTREVFEQIGLDAIFTPADPAGRRRELAWLAFPRARYALGVHASATDGLIVPDTLDRAELGISANDPGTAAAYINGGYFNHKRMADALAPECSTIGEAFIGERQLPGLPVPDEYRDDFHMLQADHGSSLTVGPRLSIGGKAVFTRELEQQPRYQPPAERRADGSPDIKPGSLEHAAMRNPRAAISYPPTDHGGTLRFIVGTVADRKEDSDTGYTLSELAIVCERVDVLGVGYRIDRRASAVQQLPNSSSNLDGGNSVAMGVLVPGQAPLRISQSAKGRPVANLMVVSERTGR